MKAYYDDGSLSRASELIAIVHLLARQAAREWLIAGTDDLRQPAREGASQGARSFERASLPLAMTVATRSSYPPISEALAEAAAGSAQAEFRTHRRAHSQKLMTRR